MRADGEDMAGDKINAPEDQRDEIPNLKVAITEKPSNYPEITILPQSEVELDLYTQARKALSFRSPFDSEEPPASQNVLLGANTLPNRVSGYSRKRQKRVHSGSEKKQKSSSPGKPKGGGVWVETEYCFRELNVEDIELIEKLTRVGYANEDKYFRIPSMDAAESLHGSYDPFNKKLAGSGKSGLLLNYNWKGEDEDEGGLEEEDGPRPMDVDCEELEAKVVEVKEEKINEVTGDFESLPESGDALHSSDKVGRNDINACNFITILKKLIDLGRVNAADMASDIGTSPDLLKSELIDNHVVSELRRKLVAWLKDHSLMKVKIRFPSVPKNMADAEDVQVVPVDESVTSGDVSVKSVPTCRRTKSQIQATHNSVPIARDLVMLKRSPGDEVEGELIYYQQKLRSNALARKHISDNLMSKVVKNLPLEIDLEGQRKWDNILVTQYNHELREARKEGKKERKHKEAQAILAAATAAAASSSRVSSIRKDTLEESHKADTQKHGVEELKSLKHVRVELERLRLLCERIVRREKLKREIVLSSREILASERSSLLLNLARHPYYQQDVSSESATALNRCYGDGDAKN